MKKQIYITLVATLSMLSFNTKAQSYLNGYFGYFTNELSYGDTISHEQEDSIAFATELTLDSLHLFDEINLRLTDTLETKEFYYTAKIEPTAEPLGYADVKGTNFIFIGRPHVFKIIVPKAALLELTYIRIRVKLLDGTWVNLLQQHI